jgi:Ca-activated chloride channel family protein
MFLVIENKLLFVIIITVFISIVTFFLFFYLRILRKEKKVISSLEKKKIKLFLLIELIFITALFIFSLSFAGIKVKTNKDKGIVYLVLIDTSGSMNANDMKPNRITVAKEITKKFVEEANGLVGIITFNDYPKLLVYPTENKEEIIKKLNIINASGGTDMGDALSLAYSILDNFKGYKKVIILLSDGKPTEGPNPLEIVKENKNKATIFTVAIGKENVVLGYDMFGNPLVAVVDKKLLQELANITGGKFFEAKESQELYKAYKYIQEKSTEYYYKDISIQLKNTAFILLIIYFLIRVLTPLKV